MTVSPETGIRAAHPIVVKRLDNSGTVVTRCVIDRLGEHRVEIMDVHNMGGELSQELPHFVILSAVPNGVNNAIAHRPVINLIIVNNMRSDFMTVRAQQLHFTSEYLILSTLFLI
jgi:hypothetical protein